MDSLVISEKYAKEMGKLPDDTLSFEQAFNDVTLPDHAGAGDHAAVSPHS